MEFLPKSEDEVDEPDLDTFADKMKNMKKNIYGQVHGNIQSAQKQQKKIYDQKHAASTVSVMIIKFC